MLKYLVILLSNKSTSFCNYDVCCDAKDELISIKALKAAILFGMKENLMIQFVYPEYDMPEEYLQLIDSIDHVDIKPIRISGANDIGIVNYWEELAIDTECKTIVIRTPLDGLISNSKNLTKAIKNYTRVNIAITDSDEIPISSINEYKTWLINFATSEFKNLCLKLRRIPQINILTDRITLKAMNNCNAGVESLTVGADGNFYICPGFFHTNQSSIGNIEIGVHIPNAHLLHIENAPVCRICDAWQCKRCVFSNVNRTHELNTPGKNQCLMAHAEREASRQLLTALKANGVYIPEVEIEEIDYNDPFEKTTI